MKAVTFKYDLCFIELKKSFLCRFFYICADFFIFDFMICSACQGWPSKNTITLKF